MSRGILRSLGAALALALSGCATYDSPFVHKTEDELDLMERRDETAAASFANGDYEGACRAGAALAAEMTVSRPVHQLEQISSLLLLNRKDEAKALMMSVRNDLETLTDRKSEELAVSLWHGENNKVFKGDPHERGILYAFLAMDFIERGESEDAVRCVKNGLLADSSTEPNAQYSSDFGLLHYLGYVASRQSGDLDAAAEYKRELLATLKLSDTVRGRSDTTWARMLDDALNPNAFLVIWSGTPPSYVRGGEYEEIRQIIPGSDDLTLMTVSRGNETIALPRKLGDVNFQARTRGGREMDTVLADKAGVKKGLDASGNILIVCGLGCLGAMAGNSDAPTLIALGATGASCLALGITFHIVGKCVNSRADTRCWKNLPGTLTIAPLRLPPGKNDLVLRGYHGWDNVIRERVTLDAPTAGTLFRHVSLMPYAKSAFAPQAAYLKQALEKSKREIDEKNWMKHEVTE